MNKGIYIALSGAVLKQKNLDTYAQNIANAKTAGYKKERVTFKDYIIPVDNMNASEPDGRTMTQMSGRSIDFSSGGQSMTGNPLDMAISGEGFFSLEGDKYTRNGHFKIDGEGYLINQDGIRVLGDGGPIAVQGDAIEVSTSGEIMVDNISAGKFKIVDFDDKNALKKVSGGIFASNEAGQEVDSQISQGFVEESNVNVIQEMVKMLKNQREFESYQKMIHAFDEAASKTINEMGK